MRKYKGQEHKIKPRGKRKFYNSIVAPDAGSQARIAWKAFQRY